MHAQPSMGETSQAMGVVPRLVNRKEIAFHDIHSRLNCTVSATWGTEP